MCTPKFSSLYFSSVTTLLIFVMVQDHRFDYCHKRKFTGFHCVTRLSGVRSSVNPIEFNCGSQYVQFRMRVFSHTGGIFLPVISAT